MKHIVLKVSVLILTAIFLASCGSYYKVSEPSSDKTYYTKKIDSKREGAVIFTDEVSGSQITLQNSEVTEIDKDEFMAATEPPEKE
ncbi:MAG: hypothetical protein MI863_23710 [Desulfobacterales bacterium]|nr:hypothetical protein [Desulfobacterales bacterium]